MPAPPEPGKFNLKEAVRQHFGRDASQFTTVNSSISGKVLRYPTSDPKYVIINNKICKSATGEPIPEDEPIVILRGKDKLAYIALTAYLGHSMANKVDNDQLEALREIMRKFADFSTNHPSRMKQPDL